MKTHLCKSEGWPDALRPIAEQLLFEGSLGPTVVWQGVGVMQSGWGKHPIEITETSSASCPSVASVEFERTNMISINCTYVRGR